jgi:hypothetical protein
MDETDLVTPVCTWWGDTGALIVYGVCPPGGNCRNDLTVPRVTI